MGISGTLWLWFKSYLFNRQQCVKINNKYSYLLPVLSGIPQGSILGSLLFLVYVNDIPDYITNSLLYLFADDTKCLKTISDLADSTKLQDDIDSLNHWSEKWSLLFNNTKVVQISFKSHLPTSYTIGTSSITKVESHKDLGITLSSNLSWDAHYDHIIAKAYSILGLLRRTFSPQNPSRSKKQLYIYIYLSFNPNYYTVQFYGSHTSLNVTVFWKTDHLHTKTEIHLLPVRDSHTHALSRNTKYQTIDCQVCFYRRLFADAVKPQGCISWSWGALIGLHGVPNCSSRQSGPPWWIVSVHATY